MKNHSPPKTIIIIGLVALLTACSNSQPVTCSNGLQCSAGWSCSTDPDEPRCIPPAGCGNLALDTGEECDDGNLEDGDACSARCRFERCGNGIADPNEDCDGEATPAGKKCSDTCHFEECGNGIVDEEETCDDGNVEDGDRCSPSCQYEYCGNDIADPNEDCDGEATPGGKKCSDTCHFEQCGNGILDPGEACDDENDIAGDGCSYECMSNETCGNGYHDEDDEACDCGKDMHTLNPECDKPNSHGTCSSDCQLRCGDGEISPPEEACDDAFEVPLFCAALAPGEDPRSDAMGTAGCDMCEVVAGDCNDLDWIQIADYPNSIDSTELRAVWGTTYDGMLIVGAHGVILRYSGSSGTTDTWVAEAPPDDSNGRTLYGVWGAKERSYVVGASGTILSRDEGGDWEHVMSPVDKDLRGVWGSDLDNVYAVGESGTILRSNAGRWTLVDLSYISPEIDGTLRSVWGSGPDNIYVVGESGTILHYSGGSWRVEAPQVAEEEYLYGVWGVGGHVYAVGDHGMILHYDPDANPAGWKRMDTPTRERISAIWGTSGTDIVAAGHGGTILHYDGQSWTPIRSSSDDDFKAIWTILGNDGQKVPIAVGTGGSIFRFAYGQNKSSKVRDHARQ